MSRAYPCVGGPLDGKEVVIAEGITSFRVAEPPNTAKFGTYSGENAAATPTGIRAHTYVLQRHAKHGMAWVVAP